jgi:hypothetical protein
MDDHRWRTCQRKVKWFRRSQAVAVAASDSVKRGREMVAYKCRYGKHYHVGGAVPIDQTQKEAQ